MSRYLVLLLALLLVLPTVARAQGPPPGYALHISPQRYYNRTISRLLHANRFETLNLTSYLVGGRDRSALDYLAPKQLQSKDMIGKPQGTYRRTLVGNTACTWINVPSSRRVVCQQAAWSEKALSTQVRALLVPAGGLLAHRSYAYSWRSPRQYHKVIVVIHAVGDPFYCGLDARCPAPRLMTTAHYTGVLRVDRDTGLPDSFVSYVHVNGRTTNAQLVDFRDDLPASIALPAGKRVACPKGTGAGAWCLWRPG